MSDDNGSMAGEDPYSEHVHALYGGWCQHSDKHFSITCIKCVDEALRAAEARGTAVANDAMREVLVAARNAIELMTHDECGHMACICYPDRDDPDCVGVIAEQTLEAIKAAMGAQG